MNKWDLLQKETNSARDLEKEMKLKLAPFVDLPVLFTSVTEKQRIFKAIEFGLEVFENKNRRIKTSELNDLMLDIINKTPPPSHRGKFIKIKYITQLPVHHPAFVFFLQLPGSRKAKLSRFFSKINFANTLNLPGSTVSIFLSKKITDMECVEDAHKWIETT